MITFQINNNTNTNLTFLPSVNNETERPIKLSEANLKQILLIKSHASLNANWDGYGANKPSSVAINKAIEFILGLRVLNVNVYFVAPTRDGDILVEIRNGNLSLEFIFSEEINDKVILLKDEELLEEYSYYESNKISYLKWLICPDGSCFD